MTMTQPLHRPRSPQQDVGRLLSLASTSLALLALPQTDEPDAGLPEGDERSEQFVAKVGEYFETLDVRCVPLTHTTHPSIPTPFIGNTNGPPLLARAHPRRAYLPRCPHRATSRVRSPTSRRRAPLPAGTVRSWWQRWDRRWRRNLEDERKYAWVARGARGARCVARRPRRSHSAEGCQARGSRGGAEEGRG